MRPKSIGLIGFDQVTASHLTGPADTLAVAALEDGFGGGVSCYRTWTIGLTSTAFTCDAGMVFQPEATLATAPPLDTIIIAGGAGLRRAQVCHELAAVALPIWKQVLNGTTITLGCNDMFGADPPRAYGFGGNATNYPSFLYDSTGRFVYVQLTKKF